MPNNSEGLKNYHRKGGFPLLLLPPELRNQIYSYLLSPGHIHVSEGIDRRPETTAACPKRFPNLLRVCWRIYNESRVFLYGYNTIHLCISDTKKSSFLSVIGAGNRKLLRSLEISASDTSFYRGPGLKDVLRTVSWIRGFRKLVVKPIPHDHPALKCMKLHVEGYGMRWETMNVDKGVVVRREKMGEVEGKTVGPTEVLFSLQEGYEASDQKEHIPGCDGYCGRPPVRGKPVWLKLKSRCPCPKCQAQER